MGVLEVVLVVIAGLLSGALALAVRRFGPRADPADRRGGPRPRLPGSALLVGAVGVAAAPVVGWLLAPRLLGVFAGTAPVMVESPTDLWVARAYGALALGVWFATPFGAILAWVFLSPRRSTKVAYLFAAATGIGATLGVLSAFMGSAATARALAQGTVGWLGAQLMLTDLMRMAAIASISLGLYGACVGAVGVASGSSARGLRVAIRLTAGLPLLATGSAALATPPDPLSLLLLAPPLAVGWLVALGLGAALTRSRSRRLRAAESAP